MTPATTILITGASRGIGAAIAAALASPGRTLLLTARDRDSLASTAGAVEASGATAVPFAVELSDVDSIRTLINHITSGGYEVDMLVNNAGVMGEEVAPWEADARTWWHTLEVNVRAPFLLQRALVPGMLARGGGRVVDLSSGAAVYDNADSSDYYVSKTALYRLGSSMHDAGHAQGLRVFEVAPGVVQTDMTRDMNSHAGRTEWNDASEVAAIIRAISDGELDGISGTQVRAGTDTVDDLRRRSQTGVSPEERRLRMTPWDNA